MAWSTARWSSASSPQTASAISPLTFATARCTPLPEKRSPPSRSSTASRMPVEAPDGRDGTAPRTGVEQHLGLDGRVAAGVEDLAPDHVLNGAHDISPWLSPLVGHRGTRLAVAHLGLRGRPRPRGCPRATTARGRAAPVRRRRRGAGPGWPRRRGARPTPGARSPPSVDSGSSGCGSVPSARRVERRQRSRGVSPAVASSGSSPTARALRASLVASIRAGSAAGMPSVTLLRPFSLFLMASQLVTTWSALSASTSPNTCGWRCTSLSCTPLATPARSKLPGLVGQAGVEDDLEEQVAQLLLEVRVRGGVAVGPGRRRAPPARRAPRSSPRRDAA